MGNNYANFACYGPEQLEIVTTLRQSNRRALVTPTVNRVTIVFDQAADDLDGAEIDAVGELISGIQNCPVLASAVIADDELWLGLYDGGSLTVEYSSRGRHGGAALICRAFRRSWALPFVWMLMHLPYVVFETLRHAAIAKTLGITNWCVATGWRYVVDQDELPHGLNRDDLVSTIEK